MQSPHQCLLRRGQRFGSPTWLENWRLSELTPGPALKDALTSLSGVALSRRVEEPALIEEIPRAGEDWANVATGGCFSAVPLCLKLDQREPIRAEEGSKKRAFTTGVEIMKRETKRVMEPEEAGSEGTQGA